MLPLQNIAIAASAGSGKTYQLTNRFISLLHHAEQPERIIALTFTRNAAGEFFNQIIQKLSSAAASPQAAADLSEKLSIEADAHRYRSLLRLLVSRMHRLNLQTLDSFFFRIVSAFSLELGLAGNIQLLDASSEPRLRRAVCDALVHNRGELDEELNEFWQAFKQATYGQETRSVESTVIQFIEQLYSLYLEAPDPDLWGKENKIWPDPKSRPANIQSDKTIDWAKLATKLRTAAQNEQGLSQTKRGYFEVAAQILQDYPSDGKLNALLSHALADAESLRQGHPFIKAGRGQTEISAPLHAALLAGIEAITTHHLQLALQNTRGVYRILQAYHQHYDHIVRRPGRLSFADLTRLLSPTEGSALLANPDPTARLLLEFRLDARFDHWLFDEFQDTSRSQWAVVKNLIDEIIQDASGERSLFYVGDTKQCLYLWRGGDDRLFHEITEHYHPAIQLENLATSWRSTPAVLKAVNTAFNDIPAIAERFSPAVAKRWEKAWESHTTASDNAQLKGYAACFKAEQTENKSEWERTRDILKSLDPRKNKISVACLVRKNDHATELADYLRAQIPGLPVQTGSAIRPATDNAAGATLLQFLRLAAHPGDTLARPYLQWLDHSTPGEALTQLAPQFRERCHLNGYARATAWAAKKIKAKLPTEDRRHAHRLERLCEYAREYQHENERSLDGFHTFLTERSTNETEAGQVIIETIHKAKGLEYDAVIFLVPGIAGATDRRIAPRRDPDGNIQWILEPFKKECMQANPQLASFRENEHQQSDFGNLCIAYVGMTRARRALYLIQPSARIEQKSIAGHLRQTFGDEPDENGLLWETGQADWIRS
ncbi:MAG: ATP-dependent DNA helicase UvrD1 [Opitutia bacterium UBA7350]|nr:MAG: ATP-dependent DNA helicase UvrD1 [Opitutae bacterium UBA7350]